MQFYNGTPSYRLWKIGTKRLLGIYSGPSVDRYQSLDNESPILPDELFTHGYDASRSVAYGDWEVCPLEAEKAGYMQAACVESVRNLVIVQRQGEGQDVIRYDGRRK